MMKKLLFPAFFIILGIISLLGQIVILREITTLFYGNELFYCLGLGGWMFFTGLGSLLALRINLPKARTIFLWLTLAFLFLLLPLLIILLRFLVAKLIPQGQLPSLTFSLFVLITILFGFCFPLGMLFSWAVGRKSLVNKAYFWETAGLTLVGLVFSFILSTTSFPLPVKIDKISLGWRYKNLVESVYSKYNQILITKSSHQLNYFLNGQLAFTNQEKWENERLWKLLTPFIKKDQKIIIVGNPNLATEIKKKLSSSEVNYLEIDDKLIELGKKLLTPGVKIIPADPRRFFRQNETQWETVLFSLGNPQTLLTNRYFTKECFSLVRERLAKEGVFILIFSIPTDYLSEEAYSLSSSIYQTLTHVFPYQQLLVFDDQLILIGSKTVVSLDRSKIDSYWKENFWQSMEGWRRTEILNKLTKIKEGVNSDIQPVVFFKQQLFWQTMFNFKTSKYILFIGKILPLIFLIILLIIYFQKNRNLQLGFIVASSSFILMGLETIIIFMFQTKIGYLYSQIALIFSSVLLGMAVGVLLKQNFQRTLTGYLLILLVLLLISFGKLTQLVEQPFFWFSLAFLVGLVGGAIFALTNELYLQKEKNLGFIYAFDLFGGSFGAILVSSLMLPMTGIMGTVIYFFILVLANFLFTARLQE